MKISMYYFLVIFLVIIFDLKAKNDLKIIYSIENGRIFRIDNSNSLNLVIAGNLNQNNVQYSFISLSTDGGFTWRDIWRDYLTLFPHKNNRDIAEIIYKKDTILAAVDNGLLLRSSNNGMSWDSLKYNVKIDTNNVLNNIHCTVFKEMDRNILCYYSKSNFLLISTNFGKSWESINKPSIKDFAIDYNIDDGVILNDTIIVLSSYCYEDDTHWIIRSTNFGKTWKYYKESYNYIINFSFFNDSLGYMGGTKKYLKDYTPIIKKTTDGGINWDVIWEGKEQSAGIHRIKIYNELIFYGISSVKNILKTIDGGKTFSIVTCETPENIVNISIKDLAIIDKNKLAAVSSYGHLLFTNTDLINVLSQKKKYFNFNSFPNPLNRGQTLNIEVEIEKSGEVAIDLINTLGVKVSEVYRGYLSSGKRMIYKAFRNDIPSGYYFLRMTFGDRRTIVKALVIE